MYNLTVRYSDQHGGWKNSEISASFARWFDADGHFIAGPFQSWLRSEVPLINQADPRGTQDSLDKDDHASDEASSHLMNKESEVKVGGKLVSDSGAPKSRKYKS